MCENRLRSTDSSICFEYVQSILTNCVVHHQMQAISLDHDFFSLRLKIDQGRNARDQDSILDHDYDGEHI